VSASRGRESQTPTSDTSDSGSHNLLVDEHELHEEEIESSWEAAPAIALVIAGQVVLAIVSRTQDWTLWGFRGGSG
jgi:hypothetical protein